MSDFISIESPKSPDEMLSRIHRLGLQTGTDVEIGMNPTHLRISLAAVDRIIGNHINSAHTISTPQPEVEPQRNWVYLHPSLEIANELAIAEEQFMDGDITHSALGQIQRELRDQVIQHTDWSTTYKRLNPADKFILVYGADINGMKTAIADGTHRQCDVLIHATHPVSPEDLWAREQGIKTSEIIHLMVSGIDNTSLARWYDKPASIPMDGKGWRKLLLARVNQTI
ncbi:hypothetical protein [Leptothoe spongobia]|uniref:Uncharacterized protein n=1 Tax=Leptothoe spongobia TAU-MAC 1115 TaxID=1967444 RepID=A0A947DFX2_9CYAN|nr:hypothetical protein [Leptothoe spongobia]MBT9316313.1 hypothetical protein [Leptothoe spongobia TAU-MAC 1115]